MPDPAPVTRAAWPANRPGERYSAAVPRSGSGPPRLLIGLIRPPLFLRGASGASTGRALRRLRLCDGNRAFHHPIRRPAELGEDTVGEVRPRVGGPRPEVPVGQAGAGDAGDRVDPEEAAGLPEVAERLRAVASAGPVRVLAVAQFDAEPPVARVLPAEAGQHADQAGEGHLGGVLEGRAADQ